MYIFGVDIPLVEVILGVGVIGIIILLEITIILILISYHMKNSKRLESEIGRLTATLMRLQGKELREIDKLVQLEEKEENIIARLGKGGKPAKTRRRFVFKVERPKPVKKKPVNNLLKRVDSFIKGLRKWIPRKLKLLTFW